MEEKVSKEEEYKKIENISNSKENNKICGISIWRILGYMFIYSVIGFVIEVLYGVVSKGVIESRQSFIYGPFCCIYGVGAILMLLPLKKINTKNKFVIFIVSAIVGCSLEYFVSLFGDKVMHVKWWDYSNYFLNINGRTCLYFGIFWGILGYLLYKRINPRVDYLIDKFKQKVPRPKQKALVVIANVFLLLDWFVSTIALDYYQTRVIVENNINLRSDLKEYYARHYEEVYSNPTVKKNVLIIWGNDFMIKTFPNIKVDDVDGNPVYLNTFYPDIQNYYFKVFDSEVFNVNDVTARFDNARELADKQLKIVE